MNQAEQYLSALVSLELAYHIAEKYNEQMNKSVRHCCNKLLERITDSKIIAIINGVKRQAYPVGAVKKLRRELDSFLTTGKPN